MRKRFTAAIRQEGEWFVAQCLEVDVASQGESVEAALANLREALELYFEDSPEQAQAVPTTSVFVATVEVDAA